MQYILKILKIEHETHDVKRFIIEKPSGFSFIPGHSVMLSLNNPKFKEEKRPFSFVSTNDDNYLEFLIKKYQGGITEKIHELKIGDDLILTDMFGTIRYNKTGVFISGGTGITPFISIFRTLRKENKLLGNLLLFSNKNHKDIILEKELKDMLGENCILNLTEEKKEGYSYGKIDEVYLRAKINNFNQQFYVCGSEEFTRNIKSLLNNLKALPEKVNSEE